MTLSSSIFQLAIFQSMLSTTVAMKASTHWLSTELKMAATLPAKCSETASSNPASLSFPSLVLSLSLLMERVTPTGP